MGKVIVNILSIVIGVIGVSYILYMHKFMSQNVFVDENALSPQSIQSDMTLKYASFNIFNDSFNKKSWLQIAKSHMKLLNMKTFDFYSPNETNECDCKLVYGILSAKRGDGKESIVLIGFDDNIKYQTTTSNLLLALVKYLSFDHGSTWLARDIILIFTQTKDALNDWINMYHDKNDGPTIKCIQPRVLYRAGKIISALSLHSSSVLKCESSIVDHINMNMVGTWGDLPNLDYVSIIFYHLHDNAFDIRIHNTISKRVNHNDNKSLFNFMYVLAKGDGNELNQNFLQKNIDTVTLDIVYKCANTRKQMNYSRLRLLQSLDLIVHTMNNLLEKLHHSTFYYLLISQWKFITMSKYIPAMIILWIPILLSAIHLYMKCNLHYLLNSILIFILNLIILSLILFLIDEYHNSVGSITSIQLLLFAIILSIIPILFGFHSVSEMKCVVLLFCSLVLPCISVPNFSLAIILIIYVWLQLFPFVLLYDGVILKIWTLLISIILSPPMLNMLLNNNLFLFGHRIMILFYFPIWQANLLCILSSIISFSSLRKHKYE